MPTRSNHPPVFWCAHAPQALVKCCDHGKYASPSEAPFWQAKVHQGFRTMFRNTWQPTRGDLTCRSRNALSRWAPPSLSVPVRDFVSQSNSRAAREG